MYYEINKEAIEAMMNAPGEVRGSVLKTDERFILEKGGKKRLEQIEKELDVMGYPFSYSEIKNRKYYPWGRKVLSLLAISSVFSMDKEKVEEMGRRALSRSVLGRFFMRRFFSMENIFRKTAVMWRRYHTIGRLEVAEADKKNKKAVLRLYNINFHPIFCDYLCGYFAEKAKAVEGKEVTCKETKCYFKGESFFHEFILEAE